MLLLNIAKIDHSFEANNLIHVINSDLEVMLLLKTIDALVIPTSYILLKFQCYFISKVPLDYIGKRIWHLYFSSYHSSDKASSR
jgi:hypothetical protein